VDRNLSISSFKRVMSRAPKAFLLFLAIVIIVECTIYYASPFIAGYSAYTGIIARYRVSLQPDTNRDILIFGDSTAGVGISPKRLYENTGLTCANLATRAGTTVAANYFLFQNYLKNNNPPEYIVLMRMFHGWPSDSGYRTFELLLGNLPGKAPELLTDVRLIGGNYADLLRQVPHYLLPSQMNRGALRRIVKLLTAEKQKIPEVLTASREKMTEREQYILGEIPYSIGSEGTPEQREVGLDKKLKFVSDREFSVSSWNSYYLEQLITLADQNEMTVFICLPPVRREIYEDDSGREFLNASKAFIYDVCASHDNVVLLTDDFYFVGADQIRDNGNHLNEEEGIIFTDMLAQKISAYQDSHGK